VSAEPPPGPAVPADAGEPATGSAAPEEQPGLQPGEQLGPDLARRALRAARTGGFAPGGRSSGRRRPGDRSGTGEAGDRDAAERDAAGGGYSSAGPDPRDPQPAGELVNKLVADRGWQGTAAAAAVVARWAELVGPEVAGHCRPTALSGGELTLVAESTAWATQLRLLAGQLLARIAAEVGPGVVATIRVHGPTAPSWSRGPRRIRGRGPRDTYG